MIKNNLNKSIGKCGGGGKVPESRVKRQRKKEKIGEKKHKITSEDKISEGEGERERAREKDGERENMKSGWDKPPTKYLKKVSRS